MNATVSLSDGLLYAVKLIHLQKILASFPQNILGAWIIISASALCAKSGSNKNKYEHSSYPNYCTLVHNYLCTVVGLFLGSIISISFIDIYSYYISVTYLGLLMVAKNGQMGGLTPWPEVVLLYTLRALPWNHISFANVSGRGVPNCVA
jgi:hypothetical protein